jgi:hypothetical protein
MALKIELHTFGPVHDENCWTSNKVYLTVPNARLLYKALMFYKSEIIGPKKKEIEPIMIQENKKEKVLEIIRHIEQNKESGNYNFLIEPHLIDNIKAYQGCMLNSIGQIIGRFGYCMFYDYETKHFILKIGKNK